MSHYLAIDLGAESGRALLGSLSGRRLSVEELHRFPNTPVRVLGALYWDILRLWHEIQHGIGVATRERKLTLDGIGVDTWGVDYALLGSDGLLLDNPRHYRDARNNGVMEKLFEVVPRDQVFGYTGIQFMQINTLYQLYAMRLAGAPALGVAPRLLTIPDLFNYWLTGVARSEITIATTTQFFNPATMTWATELLERLDLPDRHPAPNSCRPARCWARCWSRRTRRSTPRPATTRPPPWPPSPPRAATTGATSARAPGR